MHTAGTQQRIKILTWLMILAASMLRTREVKGGIVDCVAVEVKGGARRRLTIDHKSENVHVRVIVSAPVILENATLIVIPTAGTTAAPQIVKGPRSPPR